MTEVDTDKRFFTVAKWSHEVENAGGDQGILQVYLTGKVDVATAPDRARDLINKVLSDDPVEFGWKEATVRVEE